MCDTGKRLGFKRDTGYTKICPECGLRYEPVIDNIGRNRVLDIKRCGFCVDTFTYPQIRSSLATGTRPEPPGHPDHPEPKVVFKHKLAKLLRSMRK